MGRALMTICDRHYMPGAVALLRSARKYHPDVTLYCFVPKEDVQFARKSLGDLAEVRSPSRSVRGVPKSLQAMEAKLQACQLAHDVVAVVDADVVFCAQADQLWDVKPGCIRAVPDLFQTLLESVPPEIRTDFEARYPDLYNRQPFNAGVIGLRPNDWPNLLQDFETALSSFSYKTFNIMFDQVFLNVLLLDACKFLPGSYNVHVSSGKPFPPDRHLIHFSCSPKPWMPTYARWHPEYYLWVRHGMVIRNLFGLGAIRAWCTYVQLKNVAGKAIRQNKVASRVFSHFGFRPRKDVSFWESAIQAPLEEPNACSETR